MYFLSKIFYNFGIRLYYIVAYLWSFFNQKARFWIQGRQVEIKKIDAFGNPVYYITHNVNAASTLSTDKVWPGGSKGLNLAGASLTIGE